MGNKFCFILVLVSYLLASSAFSLDRVAPQKIRSQADFEDGVSLYLKACKKSQRISKQALLKRLTDYVFTHPGSASYKTSLLYLESVAPSEPELIYDLLRVLQNRWFVVFGPELNVNADLLKNKSDAIQTSVKEGLVVGIVVWLVAGALLSTKPNLIPKYFSLVRHLFPLAGAAAGWSYGKIEALSAPIDSDIPPSPAHLIHLGVAPEEVISKNSLMDWMPSLMGVYAGVATTLWLPKIIAGFRVINQATTPLKLNVFYFLASVAAAVAVEQGAQAGMDWWDFNSLKNEVNACWPSLDQALTSGDDALLFTSVDQLIVKSNHLTRFVNQEYEKNLSAILEQKGSIDSVIGSWDDLYDHGYETYLVLNCLKQNFDNFKCYSRRGSAATSITHSYRVGAKVRLDSLSRQLGGFQDEQERTSLLVSYFNEKLDNQDRAVALLLRDGGIQRHPFRLLFQVASFLRTTGKEYLVPQADELMASVFKKDFVAHVLIQTFGADEGDKK